MSSSRQVKVGDVLIGGGAPVSVQGMTSAKTTDIAVTMQQVRAMAIAGADIVRVSVPDLQSVNAFGEIIKNTSVPLVADCHMDPKVAIQAAKIADKLRLNPGNMPRNALKEILAIASDRSIPIRVGVNSGSAGPLTGNIEADTKSVIDRASRYINAMTAHGFSDIVLAFKSPDPLFVIRVNQQAAKIWDFPIHLGVTQAGADDRALIFSVAALSPLLMQGIGDTLRISLTRDPVMQVRTGIMTLQALGMRARGPQLLSCPMCARSRFDVRALVAHAQPLVDNLADNLTVAIIGCEVNGPGEGVQADLAFYATPADFRVTIRGRTIFKDPDFVLASQKFLDLLDRKDFSTGDL